MVVRRLSTSPPRVDLAIALAVGVTSFVLTALVLETTTDRDWSLGGWEWPETLTTAVILVLGALWLLPVVVSRIALERRSPVRQLVRIEVERRGYRIERIPPLASTPPYALELDFEYVLAHYLTQRDDPRPFFFVQVGAFDGVRTIGCTVMFAKGVGTAC